LEIRKSTKFFTGKPRQKLTMYKIRRPKPDINTLYVEEKEGRRGLLKLEATSKVGITNIAECLSRKC